MARKKEAVSSVKPNIPYLDAIIPDIKGIISDFDRDVGNGANIEEVIEYQTLSSSKIIRLGYNDSLTREITAACEKDRNYFDRNMPLFLRMVLAYRHIREGDTIPGEFIEIGSPKKISLLEAGILDLTMFHHLFYGNELNGCNQFELCLRIPPKSRNLTFTAGTRNPNITHEVPLYSRKEDLEEYAKRSVEALTNHAKLVGDWYRINLHPNS